MRSQAFLKCLQRALSKWFACGRLFAVVVLWALIVNGRANAAPKQVVPFAFDPNSVGGPKALVGHPVPSFDVPLLSGGTGSVADYRGKVVVVTLFATWSTTSPAQLEDLERLEATYGKHGFIAIGIDELDTVAQVKTFLRGTGVTFPILLDQKYNFTYGSTVYEYGAFFEAEVIPTTLVVRSDGIVAAAFSGTVPYATLAQAVRRALSTPNSSRAGG